MMCHISFLMTDKLLRLCCGYCNRFKYIQMALTWTFNIQIMKRQRNQALDFLLDQWWLWPESFLKHWCGWRTLCPTAVNILHLESHFKSLKNYSQYLLLSFLFWIASGQFNPAGMTRKSFSPPLSKAMNIWKSYDTEASLPQ